MKSLDVLPHQKVKNKDKYSGIPIYRYTPTLKEALNQKLIDETSVKRMLEAMIVQRTFEEMVRDLDSKRFIPFDGYEFRGTAHLSVGQEATAVGAMAALSKEDYITSTHRGHGHCLNKGLFALYQMNEAELERFMSTAEENRFDTGLYNDPLDRKSVV